MKKFINFNYGFKQNTDYVARARLIKATGFDGVFLYAKYHPETYIGDILGVGLEIGSFHLSYQKCAPDGTKLVQDYVNMLWTDGDESRDYLNLLFSEIEFANKYGIKNIIMHITGGNEPPAFNDNGIRFIGNVLARCKQYGMTLCLENLRRLDYLEKVFKAIDDDCLKFCFDSGHANYMTQNADSFDWEKFGSKLYYLHLNDNDGNSDQHLPPYMGNIAWQNIINKIFFLDRDIDLTLEVRNKCCPESLSEADFLRTCMNSLNALQDAVDLREYSTLDNYIASYPESLAYAERYINDGSISGFSVNTTYTCTSPKFGESKFCLKKVRYNGVDDQSYGSICNYLKEKKTIWVHPDIFKPCDTVSEEDDITVSPTASGRTMLCIENGGMFFVKLAYTRCLGRLTRHLGSDKIKSAAEVSQLLQRAADAGRLNEKFAFLKEDTGRVVFLDKGHLFVENVEIKGNEKYEYGLIVRDGRPYPYIDREELLIPFFALFSKEYYPKTNEVIPVCRKPLLIQLFDQQDKYKSLTDYLLDEIIFPLFHTYFDALIYAGVELEAHAQNMLISIDKKGQVSRIVCRDLESAGRDVTLMQAFHIENTNTVAYKRNVFNEREKDPQRHDKYHRTHSFMFDFKLGEYLVTKLLDVAAAYDKNFSEKDAQMRIKVYNRQFIDKLPEDFFPSDWCDYENINFEQEKKERVYRWHDNPKYR